MAKTKYLLLCGWERRPWVSPRMCRGMRDVALLDCRSDGGARAGTNNNNDLCWVRLESNPRTCPNMCGTNLDFASHDRPSDGGAQAGMGKSNGFLMVAIGTEAVGVNIDV